MHELNEYSELAAGAPRRSERFRRLLFELTEPLRIAKLRLDQMRRDFDVDTAVGVQLDAIGARVGVSRELPVKLRGVYFAMDEADVGFDLGKWRGEYDPEDGVSILDDELYRSVIQARILTNHWDGTRETLGKYLEDAVAQFGVASKVLDLQDTQSMKVVLHMTKSEVPPIVWELFTRRIVDVTAAGVGFTVVDNHPWFGFDYETRSVCGLDRGYYFDWRAVNG